MPYSLLGDSGDVESRVESTGEAKMHQVPAAMNALNYLPHPAPAADNHVIPDGAQPMMPYVIMSPASASTAMGLFDKYKHRQSTAFGIVLIVIGLLSILWNAIALGTRGYAFELISHGIWGGVTYVVAGSVGIAAAKRRTKCTIIAFMVLCIVAASICLLQLIIGMFGAIHSCNFYHRYYGDTTCYVLISMSSLMSISAFVGGIIAICASTLGCRVLCCNNAQPQVTQGGVPCMVVAGQGPQPQAMQVFYMASPAQNAVHPYGLMTPTQQPQQPQPATVTAPIYQPSV